MAFEGYNPYQMGYPAPYPVPAAAYYPAYGASRPVYGQQGTGQAYAQEQQTPAQPAAAQQQGATAQQQPMQSVGFIQVRSREEAFNWPVAPGASVMFKMVNSPYCFSKTRSYNQFSDPEFITYMRIDEAGQGQAQPQQQQAPSVAANPQQGAQPEAQAPPQPRYAGVEDVDALRNVVDGVQSSLRALQRDVERLNGDLYGGGSGTRDRQKKEVENGGWSDE